jgi:hypothetical protein
MYEMLVYNVWWKIKWDLQRICYANMDQALYQITMNLILSLQAFHILDPSQSVHNIYRSIVYLCKFYADLCKICCRLCRSVADLLPVMQICSRSAANYADLWQICCQLCRSVADLLPVMQICSRSAANYADL